MGPSVKDQISELRAEGKAFGVKINEIKSYLNNCEVDGIEDRGEEMANLTLAYRHVEDAVMRLGKFLQAQAGGVNIYDQEAK